VRAGLRRRRSSGSADVAQIAVYPTGIGPSSAGAAAEAVIASGVPRRVLVTGLCGSLDARFRPGDALLYASVQDTDGITVATDVELTEALQAAIPEAHGGIRAMSTDRIATRAAEKRSLAKQSSCQAIDMESLALLELLQRAGVVVAALRVVSDAVTADLPDLNAALDTAGNLRPSALARQFFLRPIAALRLIVDASAGLRALRKAIASLPVPEIRIVS